MYEKDCAKCCFWFNSQRQCRNRNILRSQECPRCHILFTSFCEYNIEVIFQKCLRCMKWGCRTRSFKTAYLPKDPLVHIILPCSCICSLSQLLTISNSLYNDKFKHCFTTSFIRPLLLWLRLTENMAVNMPGQTLEWADSLLQLCSSLGLQNHDETSSDVYRRGIESFGTL